jgi:ATP-dependent Clp protease ATP-binding subunit ClpA
VDFKNTVIIMTSNIGKKMTAKEKELVKKLQELEKEDPRAFLEE